MYNIYDLIPSQDVADFNRINKKSFSPAEKAIIININEDIDLLEKRMLIQDLLNRNKPESFNSIKHCTDLNDPYNTIKNSIEFKVRELQNIYEGNNCVYKLIITEYCNDKSIEGSPLYFSSFDLASDSLLSYYADILADHIDVKTELYSRIVKIELDGEYKREVVYLFHNTTLINIYGSDGTTFDSASFYIPHPFKKGDIVKYKSQEGILYGVVPYDIKINETDSELGSFYSSLDSYDPIERKFYYTDWAEYVYFEKCDICDLPDSMNVLILLRDVHIGELDIMTLINSIQENTFVKLANRKKEEYMNCNRLAKDTIIEV